MTAGASTPIVAGVPADPVVITVAPTGPLTTRDDHPRVPLTPEEIGTAVAEAYEAGAAVAHIHARDEDGMPTADPATYAAIVEEIRSRCGIVIQASTGVGLTGRARGAPRDHRLRRGRRLDGDPQPRLDDLRDGGVLESAGFRRAPRRRR